MAMCGMLGRFMLAYSVVVGALLSPEKGPPPPFYLKAYHKAHIELLCGTGQNQVRKHLESNSSPEGKSNGNPD